MVPRTSMLRCYGRLERVLKDLALRIKLLIALEFFLRLASLLLIVLLGSLFAQKGKELWPFLPFIYYLLTSVCLILALAWGCWKLLPRPSLTRVARVLENAFPRLKDDVTNALLLFQQMRKSPAGSPVSEELVEAHLHKTALAVDDIPLSRVVSFKRTIVHLRLLIPLFTVFLVVLAFDPAFPGRTFAFMIHPFSALPARETFIVLEPAPAVVLRGSPLTIKARAEGYIPDRLSLKVQPRDGVAALFAMTPIEGGGFSHMIASARTSFAYQALSDRAASPTYAVQVVEAPAIGKMRLTLTPPGYTHLPPEISEEGNISVLKGTVVNLEALATKPVAEGRLILDGKNQLPLKASGKRLQGTIPVFYPVSYVLSIKDELGFQNVDPVRYRIKLIPDKYPEGEILRPAEDMEVSGRELLPLSYRARDDFGVTAVRLIYEIGETKRALTLQNLQKRRSSGQEDFNWDLSALALKPGERVSYYLEVWDNDTVSGPKAGYSRTLMLQVRDEKVQAARGVEEVREISDALLDLLADQLEELKNRNELASELGRIKEKVESHLEKTGPEKVERYDLESLQRNMAALERRIAELPEEQVNQEMERLALLAEDMVEKARMREVETLASEIGNRQRRFLDALRARQGPLPADELQGLMKELDQLRDLTRQIMEALGKMASQLPEDFINSPELQGLNFQDLFKDIDEIQKKLLAGDLQGAQELAQRLLQNLASMMAALGRAGAHANQGSFGRLQSEMTRQTGELDKILAEQRQIFSGTESVHRQLKDLLSEETERRLKELAAPLREALKGLRRELPSEQGDLLFEMERQLASGQLERFAGQVEKMERELIGKPAVRELIDSLVEMTKGLLPREREVMRAEQREEFPPLSSRQEKLREKTGELGHKVEMLSQLFPGMDTEIINNLRNAVEAMGKAAEKLRQADAPGAIPPEQEAIRNLTNSQQAMQQMSQQMAMQMQANQWGYPMVYDPRGGWAYGPWNPLPTLPQPEVKRRKVQGFTGIDREEFDPPAKDAYKAPPILREKVMETLKEEIPQAYRREVEKYFRGLTQ